jgi:hypothetical protein
VTAGITKTFFGEVCEVHPEEKGLRYQSTKRCPLCAKAASREQYAQEKETGIKRDLLDLNRRLISLTSCGLHLRKVLDHEHYHYY